MRTLGLCWVVVGALGCGENVVLGDADANGETGGRSSAGTGSVGGSSSTGGTSGGSSPASGGSSGRELMGSAGSKATEPTPEPQGAAGEGPGPDGSVPIPPDADECWHEFLPPVPQPVALEESDLEAACATAAEAPPESWSTNDAGSPSTDSQGHLVGRWQRCPDATSPDANVLEFGGNRRFRSFHFDAVGALEARESGLFYLLGSGQLEMRNVTAGDGYRTQFLSFLEDDQAFRVDGAVFARIEASASNGLDNPPSVHAGACDLVGTWDSTQIEPYTMPFSISFDSAGNFVIHDPGADECSPTSRTGTYDLTSDAFELTSNVGIGLCQWWFGGGFSPVFEDDCTRLTVHETWDNCTGGRGYFGGTTVLEKRVPALE